MQVLQPKESSCASSELEVESTELVEENIISENGDPRSQSRHVARHYSVLSDGEKEKGGRIPGRAICVSTR